MNSYAQPLSDETIEASPEMPKGDHASWMSVNDTGPWCSENERCGARKVEMIDRPVAEFRLGQLWLPRDKGVLKDMLLTLTAALWTGLAASFLFVLTVFVSHG